MTEKRKNHLRLVSTDEKAPVSWIVFAIQNGSGVISGYRFDTYEEAQQVVDSFVSQWPAAIANGVSKPRIIQIREVVIIPPALPFL